MSVSLSLNDKIVIHSKNEAYDNIHATITYLDDTYFRAYTTMHDDFLLRLDPFDTKYEITYMGLLKKAESDDFITQNGIVKDKFVVYRVKNNTNAKFAKVENIENKTVTITDITTSESLQINLENGIHPDENIYYITHISKTRIPQGLFTKETTANIFDLEELEDIEEEIDDDFILYEDNVQQSDFVNDLLAKGIAEKDALYQAGMSLVLKNNVLLSDERNRTKTIRMRDENSIPIIDEYKKNKTLPSWISITPKNKRILFTQTEQEAEENAEITDKAVFVNQEFKDELPTSTAEYENLNRIEDLEDPNAISLPRKTYLTYPDTNSIGIEGKESVIKESAFIDMVLNANEKIVPAGFVVNYYKTTNDLKDNEYSALYETSKTNYTPVELESLSLNQTRVSPKDIAVGTQYTFCIQQGDLGSPTGFIFTATILENNEETNEIKVEPINPELKTKLPAITIKKQHLELYQETENVSCIYSILGKKTFSSNIEDLISTTDIYLKMYPINVPSIVNSRRIFQYLAQMKITRRNLHYKNYKLFKRVLENNQLNFKNVMEKIFSDYQENTPKSDTIKPLIENSAFPSDILSSANIKKLYPSIEFAETNPEILNQLIYHGFDQGKTYILILAHLHQQRQLNLLREIHVSQQSKKDQLQSELSSLNDQIRRVRMAINDKMRANVDIVKEYTSTRKMKVDKEKEIVLRDFKFDSINKNLFEMIVNENPDMTHAEHRTLLITRLQQTYGREPTELEIQAHILGGTPLQIGDHVLLKNKGEMKIFTYQGKGNDFALVDTSNTRKDDAVENCLYGDMDIANMGIKELRESNDEIVYKKECITKELLEIEQQKENIEEGIITKETLDNYSSQLNKIKQDTASKMAHKTNIQKRTFNIDAITRKDVEILPLTSKEKIPTDLEELDNSEEYTREGKLLVGRSLNVIEKTADLPQTPESRHYIEFMQTFEDIYEVNFRVEDIELCFSLLRNITPLINRRTNALVISKNIKRKNDRMAIYFFFFLTACAASLILTIQSAIPPYTFSYKVGNFSFTQKGFPLSRNVAPEEQKQGIITSFGQYLRQLKTNSPHFALAYKKNPKLESWVDTIFSFVAAIISGYPTINDNLERKRKYLSEYQKPIERFNSLPIGGQEGRDYRIEDRPSPMNNTNIMINKYMALKQNLVNFEPILITSLEEPYLANSVSSFKPNEIPEIYNVLDSLRNKRPTDFYIGETIYTLDEKVIPDIPINTNYVVPRSMIYDLARKIVPNFDIEQARNDPDFQNKVLYLAKIKNLLPTIEEVQQNSIQIKLPKEKLSPEQIETTKQELLGQIEENYRSDDFVDFKDDFILNDEITKESLFANSSAIYTGLKNELFRALYSKTDPKILKHPYFKAKLSKNHRQMIDRILASNINQEILRETSKLSSTQVSNISQIFETDGNIYYVDFSRNAQYDINLYKIRILLYIKQIADKIEEIPIISNLLDIAFEKTQNTIQTVFKTKEELNEYMSFLREQERMSVIRRDEVDENGNPLTDEQKKLNQTKKALKLGIWGRGARGAWDYDPELFDIELEEQRKWDELAQRANENPNDGEFTLGMEEQLRERNALREEEEETRITGMAEEE